MILSPLSTQKTIEFQLQQEHSFRYTQVHMIPLNQLAKDSGKKNRNNSYEKGSPSPFTNNDPLRGPRVPPQDLEAEKALLGSLLLSGEAIFEIADTVKSTSFYAAKHQIIYEVIDDLGNRKEPVELLTVSGDLRSKKQFD